MSPFSERRSEVVWGALAAAFLVAQQVAAKTTRDAFFLSHHPARALPLVMMASSALAVAASLAAGRMLSRSAPRQVVPVLVGLNAALLLAGFLLAQTAPAAASVVVYLMVASTGGVLMSGYWSMVNERFDPWTAKRLVGRFALGASLGGVAGGLIAFATARAVPVPTMLPLTAGLNVAALVFLVLFRGDEPKAPASAETGAPLATLRSLPYLQVIALLVALSAGLEALLDYVLKARASAQLASGPQLAAFFASYHAGVGIAALVAQALLTRGALEGLGLAGTVALRPLAVAAAAAVSLADPRLWSAVLARGGWDVISGSVFRSGYELLYTPVPDRDKRAAKQVVDVGFDKVGAVLGGALVLAAVRLLVAPERALLVVSGGIALVLVALTRHLHRGYVTTLEGALRAGLVRLDPEDVKDSTTRFTLVPRDETRTVLGATPASSPVPRTGGDPLLDTIADLRSGDTGRIRSVLRRPGPADASLVPLLLPLVAKDDVSLLAMRALRALAPRSPGHILDAILDPAGDPVVRRRLPRLFRSAAGPRAVEGLLHGMETDSFAVRVSCAASLAQLTARSGSLGIAPARVFAAVGRALDDAGGRAEAEARLRHVFTLLAIVLEPEPLRAAERALRGRDPALRGTALEYLDTVLPRELRGSLLRLVDSVRPPRG